MYVLQSHSHVWLGRSYLEGPWAILCDLIMNYTEKLSQVQKVSEILITSKWVLDSNLRVFR